MGSKDTGGLRAPEVKIAGPTNFRAMPQDLKLFIAGEWTEGTGEGHYEVNSPVTGDHIYNVPIASQADIDRAVAAFEKIGRARGVIR